ncbi:hypothetical protein TWF788_008299 [Orbilia oligospora]|uniref:Uncharacterized protein n=1 Tax=Orbilia oligospora TaxID=2813651 RepID=A0A7C8KKF8_ORBOL|nr:hypothetical protein TWF788_008299 [Orbilia oligospora]
MSSSVLDGRIVKTPKGKIGSTALIRRRKCSWRDLLANYTKEIKYFYFDCNYTREGVHGDMEQLFKIGASPQEYGYFLNQPEFKKNLTEGEWNFIAPYYFASTALNFRVAVQKHNGYIVEATAVEKGVGRFPRSNAITKDILPVKPGELYTFGNLTAFNPDEVIMYQPIPKSIVLKLPCAVSFQFLAQACLNISKASGWNFGDLLRSRMFYYLSELLYRLPNNLISGSELDRILDDTGTNVDLENQPGSSRVKEGVASLEIDKVTTTERIDVPGLRQLLKALLSTNTISMKAFAEILLPILILRRDEDMVSHIFQTHGAESVGVKWYIGLLEIDLNKSLGYFFKADKDYQYFCEKYESHATGPDYIKHVRQFLIKGITTYLPIALTSQEAAALVAYTFQDGDITLELMQVLFPLTCTRSDIEEQYEILYGASVLDSQTRFALKDLVSFGFRRNIHILALEAVVENNFEKASVLLPYTELALSSTQLQNLDLGAFSPSYGNVWDIVGKSQFSELLRKVEEEARDPQCRRNFFRVQDIISISFRLRNFELMEFTFDLVRAHPQLYGRGLGSLVMDYVHTMDLPKSSLRIEGIFDQHLEIDSGEAEKIKPFHNLLISDLRNGQGSSTSFHVPPERLLHSAIWARNHSLARHLIAIGTKVDEEDSLGESPIVTAILEERDGEDHRISAELSSEIGIFIQLLEAKADIRCLNELRIEMSNDGIHMYRLHPDFLKAAESIDKVEIAKLWGSRFQRVFDDYDEIESNLGDRGTAFRVPPINNNPLPPTFDQTTNERVFSKLLIELGKPTWDMSEAKKSFLPHRYSVYDDIRAYFLHRTTEYKRQHHIKQIRLFLQESKDWGNAHEDPFIIKSSEKMSHVHFGSSITLLQYLAAFGSIQLLQLFFCLHPQEATAQLSQSYPQFPSPLQLAAACNYLDCVLFLIDKGSDPRETVCRTFWRTGRFFEPKRKYIGGGITPLHYAVHNGNLEMAMCFIEHGASIHVRNLSAAEESRGMTRKLQSVNWEDDAVSALELAIKLGRRDFVALFLISDKEARSQALGMAKKHRQNHIVSLIVSTWGEDLFPPQSPRAQTPRAQKRTKLCSRDISTKNNQQRPILPKGYN